jgi:phage terminase small subunit
MEIIEPYLDDDGEDEPDDPLIYPGYARARIVSVGEAGGSTWYVIEHIDAPELGGIEVDDEAARVVSQYESARRRQAEALVLAGRRWIKPAVAPPAAPAGVLAAHKLTARQEEFCRHYVAQPVAARAAVLAGYGEGGARSQGSRLMHDPVILDRIAQLRAQRDLRYVVEADTLHDKLEAIFFEALADRNHAAAVAALRLQAGLAQLPTRASPQPRATAAKAERRTRKRNKPQHRTGKRRTNRNK